MKNNKIVTGIATVLLAASLWGCPGLGDKKEKTIEGIVIPVGGDYSIPNFSSVSYCGMNNEKTFSMATTFQSSVNCFYPTSTEEFFLDNYKFKLNKVTPEEISLTYLGYNSKAK